MVRLSYINQMIPDDMHDVKYTKSKTIENYRINSIQFYEAGCHKVFFIKFGKLRANGATKRKKLIVIMCLSDVEQMVSLVG